MINLSDLVGYCDERISVEEIQDFPGAFNGLQLENDGKVSKIGAAVDAGYIPFQKATDRGIDFMIVHHGLFWVPPTPLTESNYLKVKHCMTNNLAVYGAHLPLDCHPEIGNNALLSEKIGFEKYGTFLPYEGKDIGLLAKAPSPLSRENIKSRLENLFPKGIQAIEFGSENPTQVAILTGSGQSAVDQIKNQGVDTLITGELKQHHFNYAQEAGLNLYLCGHYATETFGVDALGKELAAQFDLPYEFVETECPL